MKKIMAVSLIALLMLHVVYPPKKAEAALPFVAAAGAIEVGAIALWGGAALVAAAGTYVGMSEETKQRVMDWGRGVWERADQTTKDAITYSVAAMRNDYSTTARYHLEWSADVVDWLRADLAAEFSVAVAPAGVVTYTAGFRGVPNMQYPNHIVVRQISNGAIIYYSFLGALDQASNVYYFGDNIRLQTTADVEATPQAAPSVSYLPWTLSNLEQNMPPYMWSKQGHVGQSAHSDKIHLLNNGNVAREIIWTNFDITWQGSGELFWDSTTNSVVVPVDFPVAISIPAPRGEVNENDEVEYETPTWGRVAGTVGAGVAVGYVGSNTDLIEADEIAVSTTTPGTGDGEYSPPTTGGLNFAPLLMAGNLLTTKFPFSIPWDLKRQLNIFNVTPTAPTINIDIGNFIQIAGFVVPLRFSIDFSQFDTIALITRWFTTLCVDIGFILMIRRFMPE